MQPRAIETRYAGYRFRSRLEARWAVFFDAMGLKWEYEPEGFELPGGVRYLPDFRIAGDWFEVKPERDSADKARLFAESTGQTIYVLDGHPDLRAYVGWSGTSGPSNMIFIPSGYKYSPFFVATSEADQRRYPRQDFHWEALDVEAAVLASRSARFEFGESGAR
jgi:hypothetical protein